MLCLLLAAEVIPLSVASRDNNEAIVSVRNRTHSLTVNLTESVGIVGNVAIMELWMWF